MTKKVECPRCLGTCWLNPVDYLTGLKVPLGQAATAGHHVNGAWCPQCDGDGKVTEKEAERLIGVLGNE